MMKAIKSLLTVLLILNIAGCATTKKVLPLHDEVLVYKLPYDLTYLRTFEALDMQEGWLIDNTDKEKGIIVLRNVDFSRLDDSDKRVLNFLVKRVDRAHTSVQLALDSQRTLNGGDMLKAVGEKLSAELK